MIFKIEKSIPIPRNVCRLKYPFGQMIVGDSFSVSDEIGETARNSAYIYGRRHKMAFSSRNMKDGTYRTWRIK